MLIKCPQCNHDNQLGAIFCRNCGTKLDVETIRPKVVDQRTSSWDLFSLLRQLVSLVVFLGLIGVIVMMFLPSPDNAQALSESQVEEVKIKFDELARRVEGGFGRDAYSFSPAEVTYLCNEKFVAKPAAEGEDAGGSYHIQRLSVALDAQNYTTLRLGTKLAGKLPATFEIRGFIPEPAEGQPAARLTVTKAQMGRMKMPDFVRQSIIGKYLPVADSPQLKKILAATARIEVKDGQYVVSLKP